MKEGHTTYKINIYICLYFFIFMIQIKIARREIQLPLYRIHFEKSLNFLLKYRILVRTNILFSLLKLYVGFNSSIF